MPRHFGSAWLTAKARSPKFWAVSAAPTVPEWRMARPVLAPALMPDTTASNSPPNPPSTPASTHIAGGPARAHASTPSAPGSSARCTGRWPERSKRPTDAAVPLAS